MRTVLQRTDGASVSVGGEVVASFEGEGLVALVGVTHGDGPPEVATTVRKIAELRILDGERSVLDADMRLALVNDGPVTIVLDVPPAP